MTFDRTLKYNITANTNTQEMQDIINYKAKLENGKNNIQYKLENQHGLKIEQNNIRESDKEKVSILFNCDNKMDKEIKMLQSEEGVLAFLAAET